MADAQGCAASPPCVPPAPARCRLLPASLGAPASSETASRSSCSREAAITSGGQPTRAHACSSALASSSLLPPCSDWSRMPARLLFYLELAHASESAQLAAPFPVCNAPPASTPASQPPTRQRRAEQRQRSPQAALPPVADHHGALPLQLLQRSLQGPAHQPRLQKANQRGPEDIAGAAQGGSAGSMGDCRAQTDCTPASPYLVARSQAGGLASLRRRAVLIGGEVHHPCHQLRPGQRLRALQRDVQRAICGFRGKGRAGFCDAQRRQRTPTGGATSCSSVISSAATEQNMFSRGYLPRWPAPQPGPPAGSRSWSCLRAQQEDSNAETGSWLHTSE